MSRPEVFDRAEVLGWMRQEIADVGDVAAWARRHGLYALSVEKVLAGAEPPNDAMLEAVGFERAELYVPLPLGRIPPPPPAASSPVAPDPLSPFRPGLK